MRDRRTHHPKRFSFIDRVDPRVRVLAAGGFVAMAAVANRWAALAMLLVAAVLALAIRREPPREVVRHLAPLNVILLVLAAVLPLTTPGSPLAVAGPLHWSRDGLLLAGLIVLKGNAILLALIVLLGSMEMATLGHALSHLRVPDKLIHLLLFTVRYVDVLRRESHRLHTAMKMRGFRPRMNRHTYRAYGHWVGMLLVRSLDRAERIVAAMKCRGFRGRFYLLDHFVLAPWRDLPFAAGCLGLLLAVAWVEWR